MKKSVVFFLLIIIFLEQPTFAQFTTDDYKKALWMTTRMYGGQRSGNGPNWMIMDHQVTNNGKTRNGVDFIDDNYQGYDLSGGWHDCGDFVKFGQTQYYAGYVLLLGYQAFPTGYDDYYSFNYNGYHAAADFSWEGAHHDPDGIPDVLNEVKYATDYYIKCIPNSTTFYSQVGNGDYDHKKWVTSVYKSTLSADLGGAPRDVMKNPDDAALPSHCGAALALMSRVYKKFDAVYADQCLQHAVYAYDYAKAHPKSGAYTIEGAYYSPDNDWKDNFICLCTELYLATGDVKYKIDAFTYESSIQENYWAMDYTNSQDLALYALARLGSSAAATKLKNTAERYISKVNARGAIQAGGSWGMLRYSSNAAFVVAIWQQFNNQTTVHTAVSGTANYILGSNSKGLSFIVGFGSKYPQHPHHRNIYLDDSDNIGNQLVIPQRNKQAGLLVGGTYDPASFTDDINTYSTAEGGIDYQAGLVGVLAFINSKLDPVDTSKFVNINSLNKNQIQKTINIFPNPSKGQIRIAGNSASEYEIIIREITGTEALRLTAREDELIDVSILENGIYIIEFVNDKKSSFLKFIKQD